MCRAVISVLDPPSSTQYSCGFGPTTELLRIEELYSLQNLHGRLSLNRRAASAATNLLILVVTQPRVIIANPLLDQESNTRHVQGAPPVAYVCLVRLRPRPPPLLPRLPA